MLKDLGDGEWDILKARNPDWNEVDLRDNRYDQIIHLITAASGAEKFYSLENNFTRTETLDDARLVDERTAKAWVGHPCIDFIDNSTGFEKKIARTLLVISYISLNLNLLLINSFYKLRYFSKSVENSTHKMIH